MKNFTLTVFSLLLATGLWAQPCSNLFFSEYIEGSSNNKALEIYNPSSSAIDLSNYKLYRYNNGSTTLSDSLGLSGLLAPGAVYLIANPSADAALTGPADTTHTITFYNGDDVVAIYDIAQGQIIDVIGEIGVDPGTNWPVDTGATSEYTLVRKASINQGSSDWSVGATQWDVYPQNDFTHFGSHTMTPCAPVVDTLVVFSPISRSVLNSVTSTSTNLVLSGLAANPSTFTVDVVLKSGDASLVNNYTTQTVTFTNTISETFPLTVTAALWPSAATLEFALRNPTGNLLLGADSIFTLTISPAPVTPVYPIATVRGANTDGLPDSLGVVCTVRGTVYGGNLRTAGLNFTINDGTAGMGVFSPTDDFGYTVSEGDSIEVTGEVSHYNGLAQMSFVTALTVLGTGTVPAPVVVVELDESTEGELIRLNGYRAYGQPTGNNPLTYDITNGTDSTEMVIYSSTGISTTIPAQFDVIGIGRQFDAGGGTPIRYTRFYQIAPRRQTDISPVGINEINSGVLAIYPNPATNMVYVELESNVPAQSVKVFDFTGRLVMEQNVTGATSVKMDISSLNNGMYLLQVVTAQGTSTHKVVKQ